MQSSDVELVNHTYFSTSNVALDNGDDLYNWFKINVTDSILNNMSEFAEKNSGWALSRIFFLEVAINKYELAAGSSYIPLPKPISQKHAIVNVRNMDQACFFWASNSF